MDYKLEGNCYVVARGRDDDNEQYLDLLYNHKNDLVLFPESNMRFIDKVTYLPYNKSIVTENPYLISSYSKENVWVINGRNKWVNPNEQTFGCSVNIIENNILGWNTSIAILPQIKLKELLGGLPKECKTYKDYIDLSKKQFKDFKYDEY